MSALGEFPSARGFFVRAGLPSWESYASAHDLTLHGQGDERRAVCGVHRGERDSLAINITSGAWLCHSCGEYGGDVLEYHRRTIGATFEETARELGAWIDQDRPHKAPARLVAARPRAPCVDTEDRRRKLAQAAAIWAATGPIEPDTPAAQYLLGRACVLPPHDSDLRWLPSLSLFGFTGPALVGRMTLAQDFRAGRGVHITWLAQEAVAWRRTERRYLGPKAGCVVRLWPDEAVTLGLGIAEGIETALALAHAVTPTWACLDAGNLAAFPVLPGIEALTIAADNDQAGIEAADKCATRWAGSGAEVRIVMPGSKGTDVNDVARAAI